MDDLWLQWKLHMLKYVLFYYINRKTMDDFSVQHKLAVSFTWEYLLLFFLYLWLKLEISLNCGSFLFHLLKSSMTVSYISFDNLMIDSSVPNGSWKHSFTFLSPYMHCWTRSLHVHVVVETQMMELEVEVDENIQHLQGCTPTSTVR